MTSETFPFNYLEQARPGVNQKRRNKTLLGEAILSRELVIISYDNLNWPT